MNRPRRLLRLAATRPRHYLLILLTGLVLGILVSQTPVHGQLSRWLEDAVHELTAERIRYEDVLVIDVDEPALAALEAELGAWPYPRGVYAEVLDYLVAAGARAVVFDILMAERREGDDALAASLARVADVWLAARGQGFVLAPTGDHLARVERLAWPVTRPAAATPWKDFLLPRPVLEAGAGVGIISVTPDPDGVLRRVSLLHEAQGHVLPAMPLAALFPANARPGAQSTPDRLRIGQREWPLDGQGNAILRVPGNRDFLRIVGFDQALAAARGAAPGPLSREQVLGRTVFIGSSAAVLGDYARIPVHGRTAGLGILALTFASLSHDRVMRAPLLQLDLLLVLLAAALPLLHTNRRDCPELAIAFWAAMGGAAALTVHVAVFGWLHRSSDVVFALTVGLFVMLIQLALRFRTLYEERRELWLQKRAADEANALKGRFLAHMTHELRTPLTAIMGYNRLLAEASVSDDDRRERTAVVERNGQHLLSLINNLLDQARIEAGQMSVEPEPTRLHDLLEECAATLRPLAEEKGLALRLSSTQQVPAAVQVDPLRLRQILLNLTGNAIKFTDEGQVAISVDWADGRLEVQVNDTGPGMSEAALGRIFEAFQQADATITRSHGGTGLGLTISRNLASLMGGDIQVASQPGRGTRFTVRVDAPRAETPDASATPPAPGRSAPSQAHVLVADDTPDIRELLDLQLRRLGVRVSTAGDGREAVALALERAPDLVIMDVEMPVMNGIDATRALRESGFDGTVLMLTAHSDEAFLERINGSGCDGVLAKPLAGERLAAVLREHLGVGG